MAKIFYARVDEFWRKEEKYAYLDDLQDGGQIEWQEIQPDAKHNWLTEGMRDDFEGFISLGEKQAKFPGRLDPRTLFQFYSNGVKTNRDGWVYNFSRDVLISNIKRTIDFYNDHVSRWNRRADERLDDFVINDDTLISWSRDLKVDLSKGRLAEFAESKIRNALYRPFTKSFLFFDRILNEEVYVFPRIFPVEATENENRSICVVIEAQIPFSSQMAACIPCLHFGGRQTQCFPFYAYDEDGTNRRENITDWALEQFRTHYADKSISKWDIFHYVYAVLQHPLYRELTRQTSNANCRAFLTLPTSRDSRKSASA